MITRFALFEGTLRPGMADTFRADVMARLMPLWRQFPGQTEVKIMFGEDRDPGAPEFPLILAITYPDKAAMELALAAPVRAQSRDVTGEIVARCFDGRIHHHVTQAHSYTA